MRVSERELQRLADEITEAIARHPQVELTGDKRAVSGKIFSVFIDNFRQEQEIDEEAEKMAEQLARKAGGMDIRKLMTGIKERLAKDKGFVL